MNDTTMKILVFGGTTEGRLILESGLPCVYSTATTYGSESVTALPGQEILSGRLDVRAMTELASRSDLAGVIDATHPYAAEARKTIAAACKSAGRPLFRVTREAAGNREEIDIVSVVSAEEAADYLSKVEGNALVAVGSKELRHFTKVPNFAQRLYFRVLPTSDVLLQCEALGVSASKLIAEQGPFSELSNRAHLERAQARFLVTKDGGPQGGMEEKFRAARGCGVQVVLIERPQTPDTCQAESGGPDGAIRWARRLLGIETHSCMSEWKKPTPTTGKNRRTIRVGSRESRLAVVQARLVIDAVARAHPELEFELVTMKTQGDRFSAAHPDASLPPNPGNVVKGLFVKELESALHEGRIDFAVHSLKDMSVFENAELPIVALSPREAPCDVAVFREGFRLDKIPGTAALAGLVGGCSSARRRVQLERAVACRMKPVRGNILTRLEKLDKSGDYDFLILAEAGLLRLDLRDRIGFRFDRGTMLPAPGQGVLACQGRAGEDYGYLKSFHDADVAICATAERAFAAATGGGCSSPVGAWAETAGGELRLFGFFADEEKDIFRRGELAGDPRDAVGLGKALAARLLA